MDFHYLKLEIFIPETHLDLLKKSLREVDAGHLGDYDSCISYSKVTGTWRPLENTHPYIGELGKISEEPEIKVEVNIRSENLQETLAAIKKIHPFEQPLINIIPLLLVAI